MTEQQFDKYMVEVHKQTALLEEIRKLLAVEVHAASAPYQPVGPVPVEPKPPQGGSGVPPKVGQGVTEKLNRPNSQGGKRR